MDFQLPEDSKVAMLSIAAMEIVFALNGCNHSIQLIGLAAISGLGGFSLGVVKGEKAKSQG